MERDSRVDFQNESTWTLIRSVSAVLDPSEGATDNKVYFVSRLSGDDAVLQNRIVVNGANGKHQFMWSSSNAIGGAWCEIEDLDGDGAKEVILIDRESVVRVVAYGHGEFVFRPGPRNGSDELWSAGPARLIDLDRDGRLEIVVFGADPRIPVESQFPPYPPTVKRWNRTSGFEDAPPELQAAFKERARKEGAASRSQATNQSSSPALRQIEACRKTVTDIGGVSAWATTLEYDVEANSTGSVSRLKLRPPKPPANPGELLDIPSFESCIRRWKWEGAGTSVLTLVAGAHRPWRVSVGTGAKALTLVLP
jgi:hypothetical protein